MHPAPVLDARAAQGAHRTGRFALSYTPGTDSFTHGKLMKVQHGGLIGLNRALRPQGPASPVQDIAALV
jgi:hypothetical protein